MLFFVDESFQTVGGTKVGALGAVAIPEEHYNRFCGWVYRIKKEQLGATELQECELKGNDCFAKAPFRLADAGKPSSLHRAVDLLVDGLVTNKAVVFALWTDKPELLSLRNSKTHALTDPYRFLLHEFSRFVESRGTGERGLLFLDQLGHREDKHSACALQNYISRSSKTTRYRLQRSLIQVPHYTHSSVSPGLQAADLVAYLAAHQIDPTFRAELKPWWANFERLAHYESGSGTRIRTRPTAKALAERERRRPQRRRRATGGR